MQAMRRFRQSRGEIHPLLIIEGKYHHRQIEAVHSVCEVHSMAAGSSICCRRLKNDQGVMISRVTAHSPYEARSAPHWWIAGSYLPKR